MRIAIDAMGGGLGCPLAVSACQKASQKYPQIEFLLFGDESQLNALLLECSFAYKIIHCDQVVLDEDKPAAIVRGKPRSSMHGAIGAVASGEAEAAISAGNTGAWLSLAAILIGRLDNISKPALCSQIPSLNQSRWMLDLGANPDCSAENLHQFSLLGHALCECMGTQSPTTQLLNIGIEPEKGNALVKRSAQLIGADQRINYHGFCEADTLLSGDSDIIVTDGFSGNIALKACEGTARFAAQLLAKQAGGKLVAAPLAKLNPQVYNGAFFLGLKKIVVKAHGGSDELGMTKAIEKAIMAASNNIISNIQQHIQ